MLNNVHTDWFIIVFLCKLGHLFARLETSLSLLRGKLVVLVR